MSVSTPGTKLKSEAVSPDTEVYKAWPHVLILGLILRFVSSPGVVLLPRPPLKLNIWIWAGVLPLNRQRQRTDQEMRCQCSCIQNIEHSPVPNITGDQECGGTRIYFK